MHFDNDLSRRRTHFNNVHVRSSPNAHRSGLRKEAVLTVMINTSLVTYVRSGSL
jgi:hypothetical protein